MAARPGRLAVASLGLAIWLTAANDAAAQVYSRERDIGDLRLGQRVMVDDGTCPAGQIKQIAGAQMTANGVQRVATCVPRLGPKTR